MDKNQILIDAIALHKENVSTFKDIRQHYIKEVGKEHSPEEQKEHLEMFDEMIDHSQKLVDLYSRFMK